AIDTARKLLERLDKIIAVARAFLDQRQGNEAQIAVGKHAGGTEHVAAAPAEPLAERPEPVTSAEIAGHEAHEAVIAAPMISTVMMHGHSSICLTIYLIIISSDDISRYIARYVE